MARTATARRCCRVRTGLVVETQPMNDIVRMPRPGPQPVRHFCALLRGLAEGDRHLERVALSELAKIGFHIEVDRAWRKSSPGLVSSNNESPGLRPSNPGPGRVGQDEGANPRHGLNHTPPV